MLLVCFNSSYQSNNSSTFSAFKLACYSCAVIETLNTGLITGNIVKPPQGRTSRKLPSLFSDHLSLILTSRKRPRFICGGYLRQVRLYFSVKMPVLQGAQRDFTIIGAAHLLIRQKTCSINTIRYSVGEIRFDLGDHSVLLYFETHFVFFIGDRV